MVYQFQGPYNYHADILGGWDSVAIGVYYCGYINPQNGVMYAHYVGKGTGQGGMKSRLLDHLRENLWSGVTHFGFRACDTVAEADALECSEILRCQPAYNKVGK